MTMRWMTTLATLLAVGLAVPAIAGGWEDVIEDVIAAGENIWIGRWEGDLGHGGPWQR